MQRQSLDKIGRICSTNVGNEQNSDKENLKRRDHLWDIDLVERIVCVKPFGFDV